MILKEVSEVKIVKRKTVKEIRVQQLRKKEEKGKVEATKTMMILSITEISK